MKTLMIILSFISSVAFAGNTPASETADVINVVLANADVVEALQNEGTVSLQQMEVAPIPNGSEYKLVFGRVGHTLPKQTAVTISVDNHLVPVDGAPIYKAVVGGKVSQLKDTPLPETADVLRALLLTDDVAAQLHKNYTTEIMQLNIQHDTPEAGMTTYSMLFHGFGMLPTTASVEITADFRPTATDAPAVFTGTVSIAH